MSGRTRNAPLNVGACEFHPISRLLPGCNQLANVRIAAGYVGEAPGRNVYWDTCDAHSAAVLAGVRETHDWAAVCRRVARMPAEWGRAIVAPAEYAAPSPAPRIDVELDWSTRVVSLVVGDTRVPMTVPAIELLAARLTDARRALDNTRGN